MERHSERDITGTKLLVLYKQHYLQDYPKTLNSEYSCMGYFDGMDIIDVEKAEATLFRPKCNSGISDIWYQSAGEVQNDVDGYVGRQDIGIFHCADSLQDKKTEQDFWAPDKRKIFMTVCFLQLLDNIDQEQFRAALEQQTDQDVSLLGYFTFDNADLVLFVQSNSFARITDKIKQMDVMPEVQYVHPINGVLEKTLKTGLQKQDKNASFYDTQGNELINDPVEELRIEIVGNAGEFEEKLKYVLDEANKDYTLKNYEEARWAYMTAHENYVFSLRKTDMRTALILLLPNGAATHQNGLFGKAVYNMETKLQLKNMEFKSLESESVEYKKEGVEYKKEGVKGWCRVQIERYKDYMKSAWKIGDQGIYSYCQAMIQTLNTLAQFEDFKLAKNIFYMIYPAFELFSRQLKVASNEFQNIGNSINGMKIKNAMLDFLDAVNSIVYHAIHMDQIYLMIPGCSGTTFSIPTKLSLFYLWFLSGVSEILNDTSNKYEFYLTPVMESKPYTYPVELGLPDNEDRLVCVKVSQRSLYVPGELLLILTHEIAHYVGKNMRSREVRWLKVRDTMAALIAEAIIPYWCMEQEQYLYRNYRNIYRYVSRQLQDRMDTVYARQYKEEIRYHASVVAKILKDECARILIDESGKLGAAIKGDVEKTEAVDISFEDLVSLVEKKDKIAEECDRRRIGFLGSGDCDRIIDILLREYQEVFADMSALTILEFDEEDYAYAYNVSEGREIDNANMPNKDYNRKILILREGTGKSASEKDRAHALGGEFKGESLINYWSNLDFVQDKMKEYVEECKIKLQERVGNIQVRSAVDRIRNAYRRFTTSDYSCRDIYSLINSSARKYSDKIEKRLKR